MSTCFTVLQNWSDTTKADVNMDGCSVQATTGDLPPRTIQTENNSTAVYEGLLPVADTANHTGLWSERNKTEIAIKGICVTNGFKPYYLQPRQQMEIHLLFCPTTDKNNGWPRTISINKTHLYATHEKDAKHFFLVTALFKACTEVSRARSVHYFICFNLLTDFTKVTF